MTSNFKLNLSMAFLKSAFLRGIFRMTDPVFKEDGDMSALSGTVLWTFVLFKMISLYARDL